MCSEHTVKVSALIAGACNDNEHKKVVWSTSSIILLNTKEYNTTIDHCSCLVWEK